MRIFHNLPPQPIKRNFVPHELNISIERDNTNNIIERHDEYDYRKIEGKI